MIKEAVLRCGRVVVGKPLTKRRKGRIAVKIIGTNGRAKKRIIPYEQVAVLRDIKPPERLSTG